MIRKTIIAIAATSAVAAVALPTAASAHGWHHRHGGGWGGIYIGLGDTTYASCYGYEWRQNRRGQWYQVLVRYC
jgi:hypothetical protein